MLSRYRIVRLIAVLLLTFAVAAGGAAARKRKRVPAKKLLPKAEGPITLSLESVDLPGAHAIVTVTGIMYQPEARFFTLHDTRDRHFIALDIHCESAAKSTLRCTLDLPRPYLKAKVAGLTVHLRNREIEADPHEVQSLFAAGAQAVARAGGTLDDKPAPPSLVSDPSFRARKDGGLPQGESGETTEE